MSKVITLPPNRDNANGNTISIQVIGIHENGNLDWSHVDFYIIYRQPDSLQSRKQL